MHRRIASVLMAFLLVTSGVAGFTGQAAAANSLPEGCSQIDNFIHDLLTFQNVNEGDSDCSTDAQINQAIEDMQDSDANQTEIDIYNAASSEKATSETYFTTSNNYLQDTESAAWMKMQVAVAEAYQNGSTETQALVAGREAISDYYAIKQVNLVKKYNTSITDMMYLRQQAENETDINSRFVRAFGTSASGGGYTYEPWLDSHEVSTDTVSLVNGSETVSGALQFDTYSQGSTMGDDVYVSVEDGPTVTDSDNGINDVVAEGVKVMPPDSDYNEIKAIKFQQYASQWSDIQNQNDELRAEAENFVNATYDDFSNGEANASDVISANTAMFEYGVEGSQTNDSSLYDSTAALTMMGFDTPNMSNSGTMDVSYSGNTYTGIVLARNAPGGSWETGTTYNTSNITGPVFMATVDGQKVDFVEGSTFTIDQMRAKDGSNVTSVQTTKYAYKTANTSELNQMTEQLADLRAEIESREPSGGGGSGGGIGTNTIIAGAALAGAALLFGRSKE